MKLFEISFACAFDRFNATGDHYWSSHWFSNKQHYLSLRLREGFLWKISGFSGLSSPRWDQKLIVPPEQYVYCSAAIKHGKFNEALKKLFQSHPKDFAVQQKLAEIFIFQCYFTGKITQPSSVTNFWIVEDSPIHTGKSRQCVKKKKFKNHCRYWFQCIALVKVD